MSLAACRRGTPIVEHLRPALVGSAPAFTETRGSNLDIVRAPTASPGGLRIQGVQPFRGRSSEGADRVLHSPAFRLQRRQVRGLGGQVSTRSRSSRDDAPSIGGGGGGVLALLRRTIRTSVGMGAVQLRPPPRLSTQPRFELPFGQNRRWLADGGLWAGLVENWRMSLTFTWTPARR